MNVRRLRGRLEAIEADPGVKPDARRYPCEACGAKQVYGAEELLIMLG